MKPEDIMVPKIIMRTRGAMIVLFIVLWSTNSLAFMDPTQGRWLSRDPIKEKGFQEQRLAVKSAEKDASNSYSSNFLGNLKFNETFNLYHFVFNSPINHIDPNGLWTYKFNVDKLGKPAYGHIIATAEINDTLSDLSHYWTGKASRYPEIAAANMLANPDSICPGEKIDVFDVMPQFYKDNVGTTTSVIGPNCWNAALAYNGIVTGPQYTDQIPATDFLNSYFTKGPNLAGDIIVYTSDGNDPTVKSLNLTHFAVYLADHYAFSKNGAYPGRYEVMPVADVDTIYTVRIPGYNVGRWHK